MCVRARARVCVCARESTCVCTRASACVRAREFVCMHAMYSSREGTCVSIALIQLNHSCHRVLSQRPQKPFPFSLTLADTLYVIFPNTTCDKECESSDAIVVISFHHLSRSLCYRL